MEIVYVYQRKRREFGRQPTFRDRRAELGTNIPPDPAQSRNFVERTTCHVELQGVPERSEHEVNTESVSFANRGILHIQGGWPKDVDPSDVEHTIRYRKKIEKDDEYLRSVVAMASAVEHCVRQNNAIDIYEEYFADAAAAAALGAGPGAAHAAAAAGGATGGAAAGGGDANAAAHHPDHPSAKSLNVYRDPNRIKRAASHVSWYPDDGHKIAVAYSVMQFQQMPAGMCLDSYIWDVENPAAPDQTLSPSSPLICLKYNPKDPHILVGGSYSGLLCCEFFSVSTDGQVLWWDIRKLVEPTESLMLDPEKNGNIVGGTILDFETTMPTKFMVGAENGSVFLCNKKAKNPSEKITHIFPGHHGPVYALQRNSFFTKNFLSIGDWRAQVWVEDVKSPIMSTSYSMSYLTDGCWSPTRPSVFFTGKMDGTIDVWDYVFKQNDPALTVQVCQSPIHSIKVQEHGRLVAAAARDGSTTLLELSDGLAKIQNNEKSIFSQILEREAKREKNLEAAARERRIKAAQKRPNSSALRPSGQALDELIRAADDDFFAIVNEGIAAADSAYLARPAPPSAGTVEQPTVESF